MLLLLNSDYGAVKKTFNLPLFGKFGQKWCLRCLDLKRCAKWNAIFFCRSFSLEFVSDKFGEIWSKSLRTPQKLPAPTPMPSCVQRGWKRHLRQGAFKE